MKTTDILDAAKEKLGIEKDSELAKHFGKRKSTISNYRNEIRKPDELMCFQLAEITGMEPSAVIAIVQADNETNEEKRKFWEKQAKRYGIDIKQVNIL